MPASHGSSRLSLRQSLATASSVLFFDKESASLRCIPELERNLRFSALVGWGNLAIAMLAIGYLCLGPNAGNDLGALLVIVAVVALFVSGSAWLAATVNYMNLLALRYHFGYHLHQEAKDNNDDDGTFPLATT